MANISAAMVKQLREKTGAGMMDCKNALAEVEGDVEKAIELLRKKGLATAKKRAGRALSEGITKISIITLTIDENADAENANADCEISSLIKIITRIIDEHRHSEITTRHAVVLTQVPVVTGFVNYHMKIFVIGGVVCIIST